MEEVHRTVLKSTLEEAKAVKNDLDKQSDPCVICLDSVSERATALPCKHLNFDFLCLVAWLQERATCPLCKVEVDSVQYDWKSAKEFKIYETKLNAKTRPDFPVDRPVRSTPGYRNLRGRPRPRAGWSSGRSRPVTTDGSLSCRQNVYRYQLYSLHVGTNRLSRFRDLTPTTFNRDDELISRARKWIRRELQVFEYLSPENGKTNNNVEFLLEYIIAILKTVDIKGSGGQAEDMLQDFLGKDNTRLFLHELSAWLRSPYNSLVDWDRHVQYSRIPDATAGQKLQHPVCLERTPGDQRLKRHRNVSIPCESNFGSRRHCQHYEPNQDHRQPHEHKRI